jgi:hypothetical protein
MQVAPTVSFAPNGHGLHSVADDVWGWRADRFSAGDHTTDVHDPENPTAPSARGPRAASTWRRWPRRRSGLATGGTVSEGRIELQGDHSDRLPAVLEAEGFRVA